MALSPRTARTMDLAIGEPADGLVFLAADGRRLDGRGADRIVRKVARRAGIAEAVTPHTLRHAFITAALDAGVPLRGEAAGGVHAERKDSGPSAHVVAEPGPEDLAGDQGDAMTHGS